MVKNLPANAEDSEEMGADPGSGRCPGGGHVTPLLENSMDRGAWRDTVHGGGKESDTTEQLSSCSICQL